MSFSVNKTIVMRIYAKGETYYASNYIGGVTLDGESYDLMVQSVSDADKVGYFGEGFQVGSCSVVVVNGPEHYQGPVTYDVTKVWNNRRCEIKLCDVDNDTTWAGCDVYYAGIVKNFAIGNGVISFDVDNKDYRDEKILPLETVEDVAKTVGMPASKILEDSQGKRIPLPLGDMTDTSNSVFAKGLVLSKELSWQEVWYERWFLNEFNSIGMYESGTRRYFAAQKRSIIQDTDIGAEPRLIGEYEIPVSITNKRRIQLRVKALTSLSALVNAGSSGDTETISVNDWGKIPWYDELVYYRWKINRPNIRPTILRIDDELLQVVRRPRAASIYVTRGHDGTTAAAHAADADVYLISGFAAQNMLFFTEKFPSIQISGQYYERGGSERDPDDLSMVGGWGNAVDENTTTSVHFINPGVGATPFKLWFNAHFDKVEDDFDVSAAFIAYAIWYSAGPIASTIDGILYDPDADTTRNSAPLTDQYSRFLRSTTIYPHTRSPRIDYFDESTLPENGYRYYTVQDAYTGFNKTGTDWLFPDLIEPITTYQSSYMPNNGVDLSELKDINKKLKFRFDLSEGVGQFKIFNLGLWLDLAASLIDRRILGSLKGRPVWTQIVSGCVQI